MDLITFDKTTYLMFKCIFDNVFFCYVVVISYFSNVIFYVNTNVIWSKHYYLYLSSVSLLNVSNFMSIYFRFFIDVSFYFLNNKR